MGEGADGGLTHFMMLALFLTGVFFDCLVYGDGGSGMRGSVQEESSEGIAR